MITRPDEYKHQNDSYAIVDNANVRGGIFDVADLSTANLNTIPVDKRKVRSTMVNGTDSKIYIYTGATLDNTAWGTTGNWVVGSGSSYTHPTGFTSQPSTALSGANVISRITVNDNGHITSTTSRALSYSDIGAASSSHTHSNATTSTAGFMSTTDKTKLDSITSGAEANQAAFSKVTVGGTTINALTETDTLTLVAGSNITLTPDNLTKSIVISSTGGSSSAYGFGTIAVSGKTSVVADSSADTLTLVAGNGMTLATDAVADSVTLTCSSISGSSISSSYTVTAGQTGTEITTAVRAILPTDGNLRGNEFTIYFPANSESTRMNIGTGLTFSGYFNGKLIITSAADIPSKSYVTSSRCFLLVHSCYDLDIDISSMDIFDISGNVVQIFSQFRGLRKNIITFSLCDISSSATNIVSLILSGYDYHTINIIKTNINFPVANVPCLFLGSPTIKYDTFVGEMNIVQSTCTTANVVPSNVETSSSLYKMYRFPYFKVYKISSTSFCSYWATNTNYMVIE